MTIAEPELRTLLSRVESATLDFKRDPYDWKNAGNLEFVKDLMAMANSLPASSGPGYILLGVDEDPRDRTGVLVGVPPASHLDDADYHQTVRGLLNRVPNFTYAPVQLDALSVGVVEIRPGGRPYFPTRDRGTTCKLTRFLALYRNGTSTDVADPEMILQWDRQDNGLQRKLDELKVDQASAELQPQASVTARKSLIQHLSSGDAHTIKIDVTNHGVTPFDIVLVTQRSTIKAGEQSAVLSEGVVFEARALVTPGETLNVAEFQYQPVRLMAKAVDSGLLKDGAQQLTTVTVKCVNIYDREATVSTDFEP